MLTVKQGIKLAAIIDKMDLKIDNPKGDVEQVGADFMMQFVRKLPLAEQEVYDFIAAGKGITPEEAQNVDLIAYVEELFSETSLASFFSLAAKLKRRG